MSSDLLRAELRTLADVPPPPPDLADRALRRARRTRRRQLTLVAAGVVAVLGLATGGVALSRTGHQAPPARPGGPSWVVSSYLWSDPFDPSHPIPRPKNGVAVLDPRTGRYVRVPYDLAQPSPDGRTVLVWSGLDRGLEWSLISRDDLLAGRLDRSRSLGSSEFNWYWSPDGRRLLHPRLRANELTGITLADPATSLKTSVPVPVPMRLAGDYGLAWGADSTSVLITGATVLGPGVIRRFDLRGRDLGTLRGPADLDRIFAVSPDGRYAHASRVWPPTDGRRGASGYRDGIFDLRTGRFLHGFDGEFTGWYDATRYIATDGQVVRVVAVATGQTVRSLRLPPDAGAPALSRLPAYRPNPGPYVL